MITRDNIQAVFNSIDKSDLDTIYDSDKDFVIVEASFFNVGMVVNAYPTDFNQQLFDEVSDNGNTYFDKDSFYSLLADFNIR